MTVTFPNWQSRLFLSATAHSQPIRPAKLPRIVHALLRWYERAGLRVDIGDIQIARPILLIGMPRSGTTMVQDLLCSHPGVAYITNTMNRFPRDFCAIEDMRRRLRLDFLTQRYLCDSVEVSSSSPSDALNFWVQWLGLDSYSLEYRQIRSNDLTPTQIKGMHEDIRRAIWCFGKPWRRFFCKLLATLPYLELVRNLFPDARYIHIVRDARMTANSMLKHYAREMEQQERYPVYQPDASGNKRFFIPYPRLPRLKEYVEKFGVRNIRTTAHLWDDAMTYIDSVKDKIPHYYEVRFEDILANPKYEVNRMLEFCELAPVADNHTDYWSKVQGIGAVRHKNRYGEFGTVEAICEQNLRKHGYLENAPEASSK